MTDSEKLDLILSRLEKLEKLETDITDMKSDMQGMNSRIDNLESQLKQTERVLKNEIRKECALVLDEVERVHSILDKHKADTKAHTA